MDATYNQLTTDDFTKRATQAHGGKFDYSKVEYVNSHTPVTIICPEHGPFLQKPYSHLNGRGCPKCSKTAYKTGLPGFVYFLQSGCGKFMKVGITNSPKQRLSELRSKTPFSFLVVAVYKLPGKLAPVIEKAAHQLGVPAKFSGFSGYTEWFKYNFDVEEFVHTESLKVGGIS